MFLPSPDHSAGTVTFGKSLGGAPSSGTTAIRSFRGTQSRAEAKSIADSEGSVIDQEQEHAGAALRTS